MFPSVMTDGFCPVTPNARVVDETMCILLFSSRMEYILRRLCSVWVFR
jgi:hypothetical protein